MSSSERSQTPADRGPGRAWERDPAIHAAAPEAGTKPMRLGYARCSTAQQELQSQLDALAEARCECDPVFSEKISTRVKVRPEFVKAVDFARTIKKAVPHRR
ncbi:recombinase family protein [Streptomyces mirabilis]|uniref:recombinase family protein n=1 Tax=Streptomyces mirabilis TaxID=68239 RepID=UPI00224E0780|nr:recombinase family protein [Streptomyces mirabilis]MCX5356329.1 recombinase family protein [Streptomyces mirabilis]